MNELQTETKAIQELCEEVQQRKNDLCNKYVGASVKLVIRDKKRSCLSEKVYKIDEIYVDELIIDIIIDGKHFNQNDISIVD